MTNYIATHEGRGGIRAAIVADSVNRFGKRITTFELVYHRYIHAEFMTHRMISKNSASSRAIPVPSMIDHIRKNTAMPIHWGKAQPGMQAFEEQDERVILDEFECARELAWACAKEEAIEHSLAFHKAGYAKQIVNRLTEPFQMMKVVATATDWDNFFALRRDPMAQPEIRELADCMWECYRKKYVNLLDDEDWHLPYYQNGYWRRNDFGDVTRDVHGVTLEDARLISVSCAAQTSYRKSDDTIEKARSVFSRLMDGTPKHSSPTEHQATPIPRMNDVSPFDIAGVTHISRNGLHSGNFHDWIQYRQLIKDHEVTDYEKYLQQEKI